MQQDAMCMVCLDHDSESNDSFINNMYAGCLLMNHVWEDKSTLELLLDLHTSGSELLRPTTRALQLNDTSRGEEQYN